MTTDRIEPALTAEEWANRGDPVVDGYISWEDGIVDVNSHYSGDSGNRFIPGLIALANAALPYSDDRKFKHHWVSWLREEAEILKRNGAGAGSLIATAIADALASYLPPE